MTKATSANIVATVIWHHVPGTQGRLEVRFLHAKLTDDYATEGRSSYRGRACRTDAQQALEDEHSLVVLDPVTVDEMGKPGFGWWIVRCVEGENVLFYIAGTWTALELELLNISVLEFVTMHFGVEITARFFPEISHLFELTDNTGAEAAADHFTLRTLH